MKTSTIFIAPCVKILENMSKTRDRSREKRFDPTKVGIWHLKSKA